MNWLRFSIRSLLAFTFLCALVVVLWPRPKPESELIKQLESRNRSAVHVALWTLKSNDIKTPSGINFKSPYINNEQFLNSLVDDLALLDASDLKKLDDSLRDHWQLYSPIWGPTSENWE